MTILKKCYWTFTICTRTPPKKVRELKGIHDEYEGLFEFEEGSLKPKRASGTRWISYKLAAKKVLLDKYGIFIQHLETNE